jgi:hypothetical protein
VEGRRVECFWRRLFPRFTGTESNGAVESFGHTEAAPPISEVVDHEAEERAWMAACIRLKLAAKEPEGGYA